MKSDEVGTTLKHHESFHGNVKNLSKRMKITFTLILKRYHYGAYGKCLGALGKRLRMSGNHGSSHSGLKIPKKKPLGIVQVVYGIVVWAYETLPEPRFRPVEQ